MDTLSIPYRDAATASAADVVLRLKTSPDAGLTAAEAERRRLTVGSNEARRNRTGPLAIFGRQLASPFVALLLIAAVISAFTGEYVDAAMIGLFMVINTGLGFFQEYRAGRAVEVLMHYWQEKAHVLRGGGIVLLPATELVPGDVLRLQAGDKLPADVRFLRATGVTVDESVLTGESISASKNADAVPQPPNDYASATNVGFSGTALLTGEADAVVIATGGAAALGEISTLVGETKGESAFAKQIDAFSSFILKLAVITLAFVFALHIGLGGLTNIEELVLFCIALTVGVIPEALPVVATIAMSRGASRMAQKKVIVKRLSAIDDLGSIDVLCTDKTGTVTQNVLHVGEVRAADPDACVRYALLGSSFLGESEKQQNNSFDTALWRHAGQDVRGGCKDVRKIAEQPFDPVRRRNTVLVECDGRRTLIVRGAPDDVLPLCKDVPEPLELGKHLAAQGLAGERVLAVAVMENVPANVTDLETAAKNLSYSGVISFHDPLKPDAIAAAKRAADLGVQIKILTGDSREVAGAVGVRLHLITNPLDVMTGTEFEALAPEAQHDAAARVHVFARMNPRQKFAVLSALETRFAVGFLGEGFNDAPGLKIANVGLAVEGASDIAREAADVILLNRSLGVIFDGIEEGRRTFANTIKYLRITLAGNFGNFYAVAVASFFIPFLPMTPVQILLVNLLTDVPMIAIAADTVDLADLKKPRRYDARAIVLGAIILGIVSSLFDFATFALFRSTGEHGLQTLWFAVSVLTELALIYSLRTSLPFWKAARPPAAILALTGVAAVAALVFPFTSIGGEVFGFVIPTVRQAALAAAVVVTYFAATEAVKLRMASLNRSNAKTVPVITSRA